MNNFIGRGNLGSAPIVKAITVNNEPAFVLEGSIYVDRPIKNENGEYEDRGGFWLDFNLWGREERLRHYGEVLKKGMRVLVGGELLQDTWQDKASGEQRRTMRMTADWIALDLARVERVEMMERRADAGD